MTDIKTYVTVILQVDPDGRKIPKEIIWKDGKRYEVTRVFNSRRAAAMKVGGTGIRYEIEINGGHTYIWDEEGRWFVQEHQSA